MSETKELCRENLDALTIKVLRPGERARPEVRLVGVNGHRYVVKDYAAGSNLFKRALGAYLVGRERAAMQLAARMDAVPSASGGLGPCALVTEYVEAAPATTAPAEWLTKEFYVRLRRAVDELHGCGVVHGDLKNLANILVTEDGKPILIDFTSAFCIGSNPATALVFPWMVDDDIKAIYKLKQRRTPDLLTEEEEQFLNHMDTVIRAFRWSRRYVRYAVKRLSSPEQERSSIRLK